MKSKALIIAIVLGLGVVAPTTVSAQANEAAYRSLLLELIQQLQAQIELLQAELDRRQQLEVVEFDAGSGLTATVEVVAAYELTTPGQVQDIWQPDHRAYFARAFSLFPAKYDQLIKRVLVFKGDDAVFDAYVETIPPQHTGWLYAAHEDMMTDPNSEANAELMIHELAHIVSYEESNELAAAANSQCHDYFDQHGCPAQDAYLTAFVNEFWSNRDLARAAAVADSADPLAAGNEYYEQHQTEFVTDYATQGPEEDFAESFMFYVLNEPVTGKLAQTKVDFFKQYPDLRQVKADIQEQL